jgi:hypothetical protein
VCRSITLPVLSKIRQEPRGDQFADMWMAFDCLPIFAERVGGYNVSVVSGEAEGAASANIPFCVT